MTFLQPIILWGLPLILLPVIIHLINRLRHRPQPWAAMQFLVSATRSSVSHAKLRQFLVLLFRVLAVLALILFLSRPLAGGWLGWAVSAAPDVIIILLDRSASMETQAAGTTSTWREQALKQLSQTAKEFDEKSHLILVDSALRTPQEIANAAALPQLSLATPTDTAADLPAMMQVATKWLIDNQAGTAEIWIASDLQRSNWQPNDSRWKNVTAQISALPQRVRVRLLHFEPNPQANTSITLREVIRRQSSGQPELHFISDFQRNVTENETLPLNISLDGTRSQVDLSIDGPGLRWRHRMPLGNKNGGGWGVFELPADANRRDNTNYFVYGVETPLEAIIVSSDQKQAKFLQLASVSFAGGKRQIPKVVAPSEFATAGLDAASLILWQAPLPSGATADRVRAFVEEGGTALFFPPGANDAQRFLGTGWGEVQTADAGKTFAIVRWDQEQGPLAKTDEGINLPVTQLTLERRQSIIGQKNTLATFDDGAPFLSRETLGRGEFHFCATLPSRDWSNLGDGRVLVPMVQRTLAAGGKRLQQVASIECGSLTAGDLALRWSPLDSNATKDVRLHAGVYRSGERLMAVNRPIVEDDVEALSADEARQLFGTIPFGTFQDSSKNNEPMQGEFWRIFLFGMLIFLIAESILILPPRSAQAEKAHTTGTRTPKPATVQEGVS